MTNERLVARTSFSAIHAYARRLRDLAASAQGNCQRSIDAVRLEAHVIDAHVEAEAQLVLRHGRELEPLRPAARPLHAGLLRAQTPGSTPISNLAGLELDPIERNPSFSSTSSLRWLWLAVGTTRRLRVCAAGHSEMGNLFGCTSPFPHATRKALTHRHSRGGDALQRSAPLQRLAPAE